MTFTISLWERQGRKGWRVWIGRSWATAAKAIKQIRRTCATCVPGCPGGREYLTINPRGLAVKRERVLCYRSPLQSVLAPRPLLLVVCCVGSGGKFCEGDRGTRGFVRKQGRIKNVVVDDD